MKVALREPDHEAIARRPLSLPGSPSVSQMAEMLQRVASLCPARLRTKMVTWMRAGVDRMLKDASEKSLWSLHCQHIGLVA